MRDHTRDAQIGANLRRLRGDRSQQSIADAMADRGRKWSQATVWSVETGARPLRASEAIELAEILGVPLEAFLAVPAEAAAAARLADITRRIERNEIEAQDLARERDLLTR